jgi:hypothetical protein
MMDTPNPHIHRFFHKRESAQDYLAQRVEELGSALKASDPQLLASRTGATYHRSGESSGRFELSLWDRPIELSYPSFAATFADSGKPVDVFNMAMLAYYFHTADGTRPAGTWIAFSELPAGRFYAQAFQGYTGNELTKAFGNDEARFAAAAEKVGGRRESMGDLSYQFKALPKLDLMVVCWFGDEDFPPSYRVLFDGAAGNQLTTDACAILGSTLTRRLINQ